MNDLKENITIAQAIELYNCKFDNQLQRFTIINWFKKYNFGLKIGGRWHVKRDEFIEFLNKGTK